MASALTILFLGWWLAGRSGVSGQGPYPKPSISVSPGGVIPVGGNVTIRCRNQHLGMKFLLYKAGVGNYLTYTDPAGSEAEFPITSARREQSGNYTCRYSHRTGPAAYSEPSDPVQIIVAELSYPKPSISLRPSGGVAPGGAVTIRCRGSHQNVRFHLYKDGNPNALQDMEPAGDVTEFPIHSVSWRDAGSYSCYYHKKSNRFIWSHPSDPVELVVAGEGPGSVSPLPAPPPARPSGAGPCARGKQAQGPPESMGLEHRTPPGSRASSSGCGGHTKCPSKSGHIFIPVHAPDQGVSAPMGHLEPGSALSPGHSRGDAWLGGRDRITGGFPSKGQQQLLVFRGRGRGDPCPRGSCRARGFPRGMLPWFPWLC
ncbi:osteoclast-associated immunoglobulin-like receptor isoform X1 [Chrysemys picta bellii]|uniref:osteoclast-associated immunoglobulin-like receptor isoform X1 n=1 Tax=Chrysemys picta bellii TaxID=8478 RepID=UPI0032B15D3A